MQKLIFYQSWTFWKKYFPLCVNVCDDRHQIQMPIQGEQWTAVSALWTEPAVTPFTETPAADTHTHPQKDIHITPERVTKQNFV